jgi:hypothetical protein
VTPEAAEFLRDGGWSIAHTSSGDRGGMRAHRGAVHPDEWFDPDVFLDRVEAELGFTIAQLHSVYVRGGGPLRRDLRPLRAAIDARMLALLREGTNMKKLAEVCGFSESTMDAATRRAKDAEQKAA